jgi:hypothetical protein
MENQENPWAATNTLRVPPGHAPACECSRCEKHAAALALVETALDAAEKAEDALRIHGRGVELIGARVALAAALRAVREGK